MYENYLLISPFPRRPSLRRSHYISDLTQVDFLINPEIYFKEEPQTFLHNMISSVSYLLLYNRKKTSPKLCVSSPETSSVSREMARPRVSIEGLLPCPLVSNKDVTPSLVLNGERLHRIPE